MSKQSEAVAALSDAEFEEFIRTLGKFGVPYHTRRRLC